MHRPVVPCALLALSSPLAAQCGIEAAVEAYGQGTGGTGGVPELRGVGGPLIGLPYHVKVLRGPGSAPGLVFAGLVEVDVPQPFFGGSQYVGAPYIVGTFTLDTAGDSPPLLALEVDPALCGLTAVAQAAVIDPGAQGGAALTNGLRVRFGTALGPLFPAEEYFGGDGAYGADVVKHADLDADGALDLLLAGGFKEEIYIFRGRGDGTFGPGVPYATFGRTLDLAVLDCNQDGHADVAVTHHDADLVALFLGHGDGTLAPAVAVPVGDYPRSIDAGDLDQDGLVDLGVACNAGSLLVEHAIELLFSGGDGTFGSAETFAKDPRDTHIADLDLDGLPDLVWTEGTGIHASLGEGGGAFGPPLHSVPGHGGMLALGDLDGDGFLDAANTGGFSDLELLLGQGDGTFSFLESHSTGQAAWGVAIHEIDQDTTPDVAVTNEQDHNVSILLGAGDGSVTLFPKEAHAGGNPTSITMADFDGDGIADFATASSNTFSASVRVGLGDGTFRYGEVLPKAGLGAGEIAIADFDDDGANDIVTVSDFSDSQMVSFISGAGGGLFEDTVGIDVGGRPRSVVVRDFNGDSYADPCIAGNDFVTKVFTGVHAGDYSSGIGVPGAYYPLESADLDGNGTSDLVTGAVSGVGVILNQGGATFGPALDVPLLGEPADASAIGDFDGDGTPDIASRIEDEPAGTIVLGLGDGTFGQASPIAFGFSSDAPIDIGAADLDQDGDLDLAVPHAGSFFATLALVLGNGDGTFAPPEGVQFTGGSKYASLGDVNHDGLVDVVVSQSLGVVVVPGTGGGAFGEALHFAGNGIVGRIAIGDMDGDGALDLAASNHSSTVLVLRSLLVE